MLCIFIFIIFTEMWLHCPSLKVSQAVGQPGVGQPGCDISSMF